MNPPDNKDLDGDIGTLPKQESLAADLLKMAQIPSGPITLETLKEMRIGPSIASQPVKQHKSNYTMAERKEWKKKKKKAKDVRKQAAKSRKINRKKK